MTPPVAASVSDSPCLDAPGPLMLDLEGAQLSLAESELLRHPLVGGLILFTRNFVDVVQLESLVSAVRAIRPKILIAVDHEGGRVQRFRSGFTRIPAMGRLGERYRQSPEAALELAYQCGWVLAAELLAVGIDFSFAPVLDREYGRSRVIGDRAFSQDPQEIVALASRLIDGMHDAGMAVTGKHFPGHGYVVADSHVDVPRDERSLEQIWQDDLCIFEQLMAQQKIDALMPAHVIYSEVDARPAGFSQVWLQQILRQRLAFDGVLFSDDLSMEGAGVAGTFLERAQAALLAGCDVALVCNNRAGALQVLTGLKASEVAGNARLERMRGRFSMNREALQADSRWQEFRQAIAEFTPN